MPNFPFTRDIPFATHNPSSDQPIMQTNTNSEDSIWTVDHFGFNDNNGGFHKQVHLKNEAAPGISTVDAVLFANLSLGQSWPFWQNGLATYQILAQPNAAFNNGLAMFPGGIFVQWGFVNSTTNGTVVFAQTFANTFIVLTQPYYPTGIPPSSGGVATVAVENPVPNGSFTWKFLTPSGAYTGFYWVAIGN